MAGLRNSALFAHLRGCARECGTEETLADEALRWSRGLAEPLPEPEVLRTVRSVCWRMKREDRLLVPGGVRGVLLPAPVIDGLAPACPHALGLYAVLRLRHAGRRDNFAVPVRAMAAELGWTERRLRSARQMLLDRGLLIEVHPGRRYDGDPSRYRFGGMPAAP